MNGLKELKIQNRVQGVKGDLIMLVQKTIKAKIISLTKIKEQKLRQEYDNFQLWINGLDFLTDKLYSATKQQVNRLLMKTNPNGEQPLIIRRDLIKIQKQSTKLSKYWARIPVYKKSIWVAVKFPYNQINLLEHSIRETKLIRHKRKWFLHITVQKEVEIKKCYSDVIAIDFGIRRVASVVQLSTRKPNFYGKELRKMRGHHFYLRKKLSKLKIKQYYEWIANSKEKRIINDYLHKYSDAVVEQAEQTNSLIAFGKLNGIRKNNKGKRFNRKLNSMPSYKLANYIKYKANWKGILVIEVNEAYTSQLCHRCGQLGVRYKGLFKCPYCGLIDNSDRNGALNIGKRVFSYIEKIGVSLAIPRTWAADIKTTPLKLKAETTVCDPRISCF